MLTTREEVYSALDGERDYQDYLWGPEHDRGHMRPEEWLVYMKVYLDKAFVSITESADDRAIPNTMHAIRKVTALGVAAMEVLGAPRREGH